MKLGERKANDPRWDMILNEVEKIQKDGIHVIQERGIGMEASNGHLYCIAKFYVGSEPEKDVFLFSAGDVYRNGETRMVSKVELLGTDSSNKYWYEMKDRDERNGNALVTADGYHYTVRKDASDEHGCVGHGGRQFVFEVGETTAHRLLKRGLKVHCDIHKAWFLVSHNVWSQDRIPERHRHMFPVNAVLKK